MNESEVERPTHFSKTQERFKKSGWGYSVEYSRNKGSTIDQILIHHRAALLRGFGFDNGGELNVVYVEKRLLDRTPLNAEEGIEMFKRQSGGEMGSNAGEPPVYKLILSRQEDGNFAVLERTEVPNLRATWETTFKKETFRKPPLITNRFSPTTKLNDALYSNNVGTAIKNYLHEAGAKQKKLAESIGVRPEYLSRVITGKSKPSARLLLAVGATFNLSREQTQQLLALNRVK